MCEILATLCAGLFAGVKDRLEGVGWRSGPPRLGPQLIADPLDRATSHRDDHERRFVLVRELRDSRCLLTQQAGDRGRSCVTNSEPDNLGWRSMNQAPLPKVVVLGHDHEAVLAGVLPDAAIGGTAESQVVDVGALRELGRQERNKLRAHVLIEQNFTRRD